MSHGKGGSGGSLYTREGNEMFFVLVVILAETANKSLESYSVERFY